MWSWGWWNVEARELWERLVGIDHELVKFIKTNLKKQRLLLISLFLPQRPSAIRRRIMNRIIHVA